MLGRERCAEIISFLYVKIPFLPIDQIGHFRQHSIKYIEIKREGSSNLGAEFLVGRSGSGKTKLIIDSIQDELRRAPFGKPIIFLVPDQMTFLMECELAKTPDMGGMIRAQVFSFSRLSTGASSSIREE